MGKVHVGKSGPGFDVRAANDWVKGFENKRRPRRLLGEMVVEGEMTVLFGAQGTGKSLLAVQIAESVASGRDMPGFAAEARPAKVLFVDLELTNRQFAFRYIPDEDDPDGVYFQFHKNMLRVPVDVHSDVPEGHKSFNEYLLKGIESIVREQKIKVVIIDSIGHLKRSNDTARDILPMLQGLTRLRRSRDIAVVVVAPTRRKTNAKCAALEDLQSSNVIGNFADRVFAIGRGGSDGSVRYIKQLKSRSSEILYDTTHVPYYRIEKIGGCFLGFEPMGFASEAALTSDYRDSRDWALIDRMKKMHVEGKSIREIAAELGKPKTNVHRMLQIWVPPPPPVKEAAPTAKKPYVPEFPIESYEGEHTDRHLLSIGGRAVWKEKWEREQKEKRDAEWHKEYTKDDPTDEEAMAELLAQFTDVSDVDSSEPAAIATGFLDQVTTKVHESSLNEEITDASTGFSSDDPEFSILNSQFSILN